MNIESDFEDIRLMLDDKIKLAVINELESELSRLLAERSKLAWIDHRISTLRTMIAGARALWDESNILAQKRAMGLDEPNLGGARQVSLPQAIKTVFMDAGRPLHVKEILRELQRRNFKIGSKNATVAVVTAIKRKDKDFVRTGPNTFALRRPVEPGSPV